jgi:hypothetical protein
MRIDHQSFQAFLPRQILFCPIIRSSFVQVSCERRSQCLRPHWLVNACFLRGFIDRYKRVAAKSGDMCDRQRDKSFDRCAAFAGQMSDFIIRKFLRFSSLMTLWNREIIYTTFPS